MGLTRVRCRSHRCRWPALYRRALPVDVEQRPGAMDGPGCGAIEEFVQLVSPDAHQLDGPDLLLGQPDGSEALDVCGRQPFDGEGGSRFWRPGPSWSHDEVPAKARSLQVCPQAGHDLSGVGQPPTPVSFLPARLGQGRAQPSSIQPSGVTGRDAQFLRDLIEPEPESHQPVHGGKPVEGPVLSGIVPKSVEQRPLAILQPALDQSPGPSLLGWRQHDVWVRARDGELRKKPILRDVESAVGSSDRS